MADFLNLPNKEEQVNQNVILQQIANTLEVTTDALSSAINLANIAGNNANAKIIDVENRFQTLTTEQQQDAEIIDARQGELSLGANLTAVKTQINDLDAQVLSLEAQSMQQTPLFAQGTTVEECLTWLEESGDTTKVYILPNGYIYGYKKIITNGGANFTNLLSLAIGTDGQPYNGALGYKNNYRINSSKVESAYEGAGITGYIPRKDGAIFNSGIIRFKNMPQSSTSEYIFYAKNDFSYGEGMTYESAMYATPDSNGVYSVELASSNYAKYIRISAGLMSADTIITYNEEITYAEDFEDYTWANTGHAFVPADYEDRIIEIEEETARIEVINTRLTNVESGIPNLTENEKIAAIRQWDSPIYDKTPVFQLDAEKSAIESSEKTVSAVYAKYNALMSANSDFITKTDLGLCSDGITHVYRYDFKEKESRHQSGFEWSETKLKIIIVTGIHREWNGIYSIYNALAEIATNSKLAELRRNVHFIVIPVLNPYSISGDYSEVGHALNANGVEIHRNFEVGFTVAGEGTIHYTGETALSEVESQYLDNILKNNTDASYFLTCHSFDRDATWGVGFLWGSSATKYMCNMCYRIIDKMGKAWHEKYGTTWENGIVNANSGYTAIQDNDYRIGHAALTNTGGCEQRQATKYGIQATNFETCETFFVLDSTSLSAKAITHATEAYINFFLTVCGVYDYKDKEQYYK